MLKMFFLIFVKIMDYEIIISEEADNDLKNN